MGPAVVSPQIPIVDMHEWFRDDTSSKARHECAEQLSQALQQNGCVGISGHSFKLDELFSISRQLFTLPYEDKMKAPHPDGLIPHRGYSGPGREAAAGSAAVKATESTQMQELLAAKDYKACLSGP